MKVFKNHIEFITLEVIKMKKLTRIALAAAIVCASTTVSAWGWTPWNTNTGDAQADATTNSPVNLPHGGPVYGYGPGYGNSYYGYPVHGFGVPVAPLEMTEEQRKEIAEQQAKAYQQAMENQRKAFEQFMENQRKAAEAFAKQFNSEDAPVVGMGSPFMMERELMETHARDIQEMQKQIWEDRQNHIQEMNDFFAGVENAPMPPAAFERTSLEDFEARRKEMQERFEVLRKESEQRRLEAQERRKAFMEAAPVRPAI